MIQFRRIKTPWKIRGKPQNITLWRRNTFFSFNYLLIILRSLRFSLWPIVGVPSPRWESLIWAYKMPEDWRLRRDDSERCLSDVFKSLFLSDHQPKTPKYSVTQNIIFEKLKPKNVVKIVVSNICRSTSLSDQLFQYLKLIDVAFIHAKELVMYHCFVVT